MRLIRISARQKYVQGYLHVRTRVYDVPDQVCSEATDKVLAFMISDPEYDDWMVGDDPEPRPEGWKRPPIPEGAVANPPQHGPFALDRLDPKCYVRTNVDTMMQELQDLIGRDDPLWRPPHSMRNHPFDDTAWRELKAWANSMGGRPLEVFRLKLNLEDKALLVDGEWAVQDLFVEYVVLDRVACQLRLIIVLVN